MQEQRTPSRLDALTDDIALRIVATMWERVRLDLGSARAPTRATAWAWCHGPCFLVWVDYVIPGADPDIIRDQLLRECWRPGVPRPLPVTPIVPPSTERGSSPYATGRRRTTAPAPTA